MTEALAAIAVRDTADPWTRTAVLSSVPAQALALFDALDRKPGFFDVAGGPAWLEQIAYLVGAERDPAHSRELLARLARPRLSHGNMMRAVATLARGRSSIGGSIAGLFDGEAAPQLSLVIEQATRLAGGSDAVDDRLVAIRLLGLLKSPASRELFLNMLDARQPAAIQLAVLQALARDVDGPWLGRSSRAGRR